MTTDTDKLIQVAEAAGFRVVRFNDADAYACDDEGKDITPKLAGFRTAIIASLCGDVEPVAFMFQHSETGRIAFVDAWQKENGWAAGNPRFFEVDALVPASTLAAAQALNAELVARLEISEGTLREMTQRVPCDCGCPAASQPVLMRPAHYYALAKSALEKIDAAVAARSGT